MEQWTYTSKDLLGRVSELGKICGSEKDQNVCFFPLI